MAGRVKALTWKIPSALAVAFFDFWLAGGQLETVFQTGMFPEH